MRRSSDGFATSWLPSSGSTLRSPNISSDRVSHDNISGSTGGCGSVFETSTLVADRRTTLSPSTSRSGRIMLNSAMSMAVSPCVSSAYSLPSIGRLFSRSLLEPSRSQPVPDCGLLHADRQMGGLVHAHPQPFLVDDEAS